MTEYQVFAERLVERYGDPTAELQAAYDSWLADMAARPGSALVPFEFNPREYPEQDIMVAKTEAKDPYPSLPDAVYYPAMYRSVAKSVGYLGLAKLINQINHHPSSPEDRTPLTKRLVQDRQAGKNTLVVTSHYNFPEFGYFKAMRFLAKKDRRTARKNGALMNKLMTRQKYKGDTLVKRFTPLGPVLWSYPKSETAKRHGVPTKAMRLGNALFTKVLDIELKDGGFELDAALSGSEIKPVIDEAGKLTHNRIPDIDPASAKLLEGFDQVFGATLIRHPSTGRWIMDLGELLDINELRKSHSGAEITDMVYTESIVPAVERITGVDLEYNRLANRDAKLGGIALKTP
jgi:hypothetical protein